MTKIGPAVWPVWPRNARPVHGCESLKTVHFCMKRGKHMSEFVFLSMKIFIFDSKHWFPIKFDHFGKKSSKESFIEISKFLFFWKTEVLFIHLWRKKEVFVQYWTTIDILDRKRFLKNWNFPLSKHINSFQYVEKSVARMVCITYSCNTSCFHQKLNKFVSISNGLQQILKILTESARIWKKIFWKIPFGWNIGVSIEMQLLSGKEQNFSQSYRLFWK